MTLDPDLIPGMPTDLFQSLGLIVRGNRDAWAVYSGCERYRYLLGRQWDPDRPHLVVCALNPSTATELVTDQTIRKELSFAKRDGFGTLIKVNAYGFRATDPKKLEWCRKIGGDPIGPDNDTVIRRTLACLDHVCIVAAWGRGPSAKLRPRFATVLDLLSDGDATVRCYGTNDDGSPKHPLYLPGNTPLVLFEKKR